MLPGMTEGLPIHVDDVAPQRRTSARSARRAAVSGRVAGAQRLGIALIEIDPGKRSTPPHSHADEDEVFLVLAGGGLSYQTPAAATSAPTRSASTTCSGIPPTATRTR